MPVLPLDGSMMVPPGFSRPFSSASVIMARAMRSLTEPAGLKYSSLRAMLASSAPLAARKWGTRTSGVPPMSSVMEE